MDLGIEVADVEIDMGFLSNHDGTVRLTFRRPPDSTILSEIMSLKSRYGWQVQTSTDADDIVSRKLTGDFMIVCVGAKSDDVGNAIGRRLQEHHGMKVRYSQFLKIKPGHNRWTKDVEILNLQARLTDRV